MLNHVTIQGRLTTTPELNYTAANVPYTRFCIANDTGATTNGGEKIVYFFDVTAWRKQAEFACNYLAKGRLVIVEGELTSRNYVDKNGNNRKAIEINASRLHFSDSKPQSEQSPDASDFAAGYMPRQNAPAQQSAQPPRPSYSASPPSEEPPITANDDYPF